METDTPVYVGPHKQYGVIRKILKGGAQPDSTVSTGAASGTDKALQYEVRLSTSLENVVVNPEDLKRSV